jgi:hypothetical protein
MSLTTPYECCKVGCDGKEVCQNARRPCSRMAQAQLRQFNSFLQAVKVGLGTRPSKRECRYSELNDVQVDESSQ